MSTIDVLTVVSDTTPKEWVEECKNSVTAVAHNMLFNQHIMSPGVPNHIGQAFYNALQKSTADYVCWVDDDDFLKPDALKCFEEHIIKHPPVMFARETHLFCNGHTTNIDRRHHLTVYRRDVIEAAPLLDWPLVGANLIPFASSYTGCVDILEWVYVYRRYISKAMKLRAAVRNGVEPDLSDK